MSKMQLKTAMKLFVLLAFMTSFAVVSGDLEPRCSLPKDTGPCRGYQRRYYYSEKDNQCLLFIYGGCKGNANNFKTLEECGQACG
ncbi:kappaPI-actitoxin-Avd3b-like [Ornithodoros turicata]|uniref:kappaPI-actitoxin-Avd3b-like n=1 Tax=Ornithodoros turicata TaxID=34597 RepID=UPI0031390929